MTTKKLVPLIGKTGMIRLGEFTVDVKILDIKTSWGKERYYVEPLSGFGTAWVENIKLYPVDFKIQPFEINCMYDHDHSKNKGRYCEWHN